MKILFIIFSILLLIALVWAIGAIPANTERAAAPDQRLLKLSGQFISAIRSGTPTDSIESILAKLKMDDLISGLTNDKARKTFWINMYNAWFQLLALREKKTIPEIFSQKLISIAGTKFCLDDIEHGILRKYRWKYSLGYLPQFYAPRLIKKLSVSEIDYRVHFAMNCGAKSCPRIMVYEYDKLDEQLEKAAQSFLSAETEVDQDKKEVRVTKIMEWFKGDFGGKKGIRNVLSKYLGKDFTGYEIHFNDYNWTPALKNYAAQSN